MINIKVLMRKITLFEDFDRKMINSFLFIDYREINEIHTLRNSINRGYIEIAVTALCHHLQSANVSHSKQKRQLFKVDYACKIP